MINYYIRYYYVTFLLILKEIKLGICSWALKTNIMGPGYCDGLSGGEVSSAYPSPVWPHTGR